MISLRSKRALWISSQGVVMNNYTKHKAWDEIINPFPNLNCTAVEVWERKNDFIPYFTGHVIMLGSKGTFLQGMSNNLTKYWIILYIVCGKRFDGRKWSEAVTNCHANIRHSHRENRGSVRKPVVRYAMLWHHFADRPQNVSRHKYRHYVRSSFYEHDIPRNKLSYGRNDVSNYDKQRLIYPCQLN